MGRVWIPKMAKFLTKRHSSTRPSLIVHLIPQHHNIGAIRTSLSLAIIIARVSVRARPSTQYKTLKWLHRNWYVDSLNVDIVPRWYYQSVWYKIILHSGIDLYNIPTLSPHIQIVYSSIVQFTGSRSDSKDMWPVQHCNNPVLIHSTRLTHLSWNVLPNWDVSMASLSRKSAFLNTCTSGLFLNK